MPATTLASHLMPNDRLLRILSSLLLAVVGSLLLWASAKVKVDLPLVPITLQSLAVLGIGAAFGWRLGAATVLLYLAEGASGLPVFAGTPEKGMGLAYMMGPTGGYLLGFVLAAAAVGWMAERHNASRNAFHMFAAMLIGAALIHLPGLPWLAAYIGWEKAVQFGLLPFIAGDLVKAALAGLAFPAAWLLLDRR